MSRRKITSSENNNNEVGLLAPKRSRLVVELPLPVRSRAVGYALVCGLGDMGQLGLGDDSKNYERKRLDLLPSVKDVVDVCAGGMHNLVLTKEGKLYSFGCNDEGALGRDTSEDGSEFEPRVISLPGEVIKMSAGDSHSACLLEDGRVFAWGSFRNSHGNMGLTLEGNKLVPIDLLPGKVCADIASGADHLVILTSRGQIYTVGCAEQGQLGRVSMRSASGTSRRGKTELLRPLIVLLRNTNPLLADAIWTTNYCTFVRQLKTDQIWVFGLNNYKQLTFDKPVQTVGRPVTINLKNVLQIAGGQQHTLVLTTDGTCYAIGCCNYGRLGLGEVDSDVVELKKIDAFDGVNVVSVSCGELTSYAVTADGKLYSWGMGSNHQLGTGNEDDVFVPKQILTMQTEGQRVVRASSGGQHSIFHVEGDFENAKVLATKEHEKPALTKKAAAAAAAKEKEAKQAVNDKHIEPKMLAEVSPVPVTETPIQPTAEKQPKAGAAKRGRKRK